jgi:pyruvate/2-oxoglutarate/acetoin dehydrogenase E1 component
MSALLACQFRDSHPSLPRASAVGSAFDHLDAPIHRVTGADIPTPYAKNLEDQVFPVPQNIINSVLHTLNISK